MILTKLIRHTQYDTMLSTVKTYKLNLSPRGSGLSGFYGNLSQTVVDHFFVLNLNSYITVGLMQKETVRSSKLRKLRNFEICYEIFQKS